MCLVHKKDKSFLFVFSWREGTKAEQKKKEYQKQPPLPLSSAKQKDGTRAQTHVSKVWQQREEGRWKRRQDETRREGRGVGARGNKCLDSGFRDNSHNGRHPWYTEAVNRMKLYCLVSHCYIFKCSSLYFRYEGGFATWLPFKIHITKTSTSYQKDILLNTRNAAISLSHLLNPLYMSLITVYYIVKVKKYQSWKETLRLLDYFLLID